MGRQEKSGVSAGQPAQHDMLRRRWIAHHREVKAYFSVTNALRAAQSSYVDRVRAHWRREDLALLDELDAQLKAIRMPAFPEELRNYTCGAKTRAGTPCKQRDVFANGRCKFHGGASTGPVTEAGKAQARKNGKLGGRPPKKPKPMGCM